MKLLSKLLFLVLLIVSALSQWAYPIRVGQLSSDQDDFAPCWSTVDSTLYFSRQGRSDLVVLACPWRRLLQAGFPNSNRVQFDTINDGIPYASFSAERWVGHRLTASERQPIAQLVTASALRSTSAGAVEPIVELNRENHFVMFPALSGDGRMLVFATTAESENYTTDLWVSQWDGTQWSVPFPLEGFEQSSGSEITPCFVGRDTLIFASNGFGGKGGFDLFMTVRHGGVWSAPQPLSELNSAADDRDPCLLPTGDLLFASNRTGQFDLYYARRERKLSNP
ncbi:MAG: hypothetical protein RML15_02700 [Bacteroidota bacterium]|nr:hypothetical protein [Candidatus Kapabacteria bacterium]MCS7303218.1 hypothetical protein [Candidatus Kapabacteria bacterium]MDW8271304.1 hypothetical protein [Bacteroidota bacterium]